MCTCAVAFFFFFFFAGFSAATVAIGAGFAATGAGFAAAGAGFAGAGVGFAAAGVCFAAAGVGFSAAGAGFAATGAIFVGGGGCGAGCFCAAGLFPGAQCTLPSESSTVKSFDALSVSLTSFFSSLLRSRQPISERAREASSWGGECLCGRSCSQLCRSFLN